MPHKNPDDRRAWKARYARANPKLMCEMHRRWRVKNSEKVKLQAFKRHLKNTYGITYEFYMALVDAQGGICAICKHPNADDRRLSVDHDHATGKIRALLCGLCNYGLGAFKDDKLRLSNAIDYLEYHQNV